MVKVKGMYEWKLVNKTTGDIELEGLQDNLVTDAFLNQVRWCGEAGYSLTFYNGSSSVKIVLSDTALLEEEDYRRYGVAAARIINLAVSPVLEFEFIDNKFSCSYNFDPPDTPRTIRCITLKLRNSPVASLLELTTSITQQTNQYLFVRYYLYFEILPGGLNAPENKYLKNCLNSDVDKAIKYLYVREHTDYRAPTTRVTPFLEPVNKDLVTFAVDYLRTMSDEPSIQGSKFAGTVTKDWDASSLVGPIGTFAITSKNTDENFDCTLKYFPVKENRPSVSRVFTHAADRFSALFSDPSYPPDSLGAVKVSGTPTNKWHMNTRVVITKTGDASDIESGREFTTDIATDPNCLIVDQDWTGNEAPPSTTRDKVTLKGDNLPEPLTEDTDYFVVYVDSQSIKLSTTQDGTQIIELTSDGDGTITRENTARYRMNYQPYAGKHAISMRHLRLAMDTSGNILPNIATIKGGFYLYGDYIYTFQESDDHIYVARQRFYTVEGSLALHSFSEGSTLYCTRKGVGENSSMVYIGTSDGIYIYDMESPETPPEPLAVEGLKDNVIYDLAVDKATGIMWSGHESGLSRIDLDTNTAEIYDLSNWLDGATSDSPVTSDDGLDITVRPGRLSAYGGYAVICGITYMEGSYIRNAVIVKDGVGYYRIEVGHNNGAIFDPEHTDDSSARLIIGGRGDTNIGDRTNHWIIRDVAVTGINSGSVSTPYEVTTQVTVDPISDYCRTAPVKLGRTVYSVGTYSLYVNSRFNLDTLESVFEKGDENVYDDAAPEIWRTEDDRGDFGINSMSKETIDLGEGRQLGISSTLLFSSLSGGVDFGWDGSEWVAGHSGDREIPKSAVHEILDGLSIRFNNASGFSSDSQFVEGESFQFMHGPTVIKDNLQTFRTRVRTYLSDTGVKEDIPFTVNDTVYVIPEKDLSEFRDMDTADFTNRVVEVADGSTFTVDPDVSTFEIGRSIDTGTLVYVETDDTLPAPLKKGLLYYAINVSDTSIRLASSYDNAVDEKHLIVKDSGTGVHTIYNAAEYQISTDASTLDFSVDQDNNYITYSTDRNIPTGTPVAFAEDSTPPEPLEKSVSWDYYTEDRFYYAINIDSQTIQVADTYEDALNGTPVSLTSAGSGDIRIYQVGEGNYNPRICGKFLFSPSDEGKEMRLTYYYTLFS